MARICVKLPDRALNRISGNESAVDAWTLATRDALRDALDPGETHTNWIVSDVAKWNGQSATIQGYAFLVKHMDGEVVPSPTGREWMFVLPGRTGTYTTYTSGIAHLREVFGSFTAATIAPYFTGINGATSFSGRGEIAIHYNPTALSTPYNGGWDANGELAGGDLSAPTNNPYTNLDAFMPGTSHPLGLGTQSFGYEISYWTTIWDDEKPFMAFYYTRGRESYAGGINIFGETLIPYMDSDTFTTGNLYFATNNAYNFSGSLLNSSVAMYNSTGARTFALNSVFAHDRFTAFNSKTADGDYIWDTALVVGASGTKGYVDPDIIKVIGEYNGDYYKLFESNGNYFVKMERSMAFPYVGNKPLFPPG